MDRRTEESIRDEVREIENIPYRHRSDNDKIRWNALESEIQRRHPELHTGEYPSCYFQKYPSHCLVIPILDV